MRHMTRTLHGPAMLAYLSIYRAACRALGLGLELGLGLGQGLGFGLGLGLG